MALLFMLCYDYDYGYFSVTNVQFFQFYLIIPETAVQNHLKKRVAKTVG